MQKIPNTLRILGRTWRVDFVPLKSLGGCLGDASNVTDVIQICSEIPEDCQEATLLHEIVDLLDSELQLELEHNKIQAIAAAVFSVLKDNGLIFKG